MKSLKFILELLPAYPTESLLG